MSRLVLSVGIVLIVGVIACGKKSSSPGASKANPNPTPTYSYTPPADVAAYWQRPIALQGPSKANTAIEKSMLPKDCGVCHPSQLALWKTSRHAMATGPGIHAQMLEKLDTDKPSLKVCASCHFPLTEQFKVVPGTNKPNKDYDPALYQSGLTCAACHMRGREIHGPKGRTPPMENAPHNGYKVKPFFAKSEFCATCHQFTKGWTSLAGKYLENTYYEWKQSKYAKEGKQCQGCHMVDRQHLWRGIHDKAMTLSGVTIAVNGEDKWKAGTANALVITVQNSGVGHMLPTYVTPAIYVRFVQVDASGSAIKGTAVQHRIQRHIKVDLSRETEDTRIAPGATSSFAYGKKRADSAVAVKLEIEVDPDEFYRRFYQVSLRNNSKMTPAVTEQYKRALKESIDNKYILWTKQVALN